ncbi:MAG: aspartate aminotransferase family protein [Deltaproteobacteria bacterium]|nr:MAG: aspartate aminotransferase family protein [Deltaproteobacteria bacterium]
MRLPEKGLDRKALFERLETYRERDVDWRSGRVFGYVFDPGAEAMEVGKEAYAMFLTENGLDFTSFPSLMSLENDLVGMARAHLGGDEAVVGNFTSGGTESIILAVKTARDYARATRPQVGEPEMILPVTAHAAFHKAAHYLGVKVVQTGVNPNSFRADVAEMRRAVGPRTILLVGSAPSYTHGVVDPIEQMGALAWEKGILLHVDACMGGFLLPYLRRLGEPVPPFDLSVPGVTSISMDLHKYAYTPKGASIILYRDKELRRHQIFACSRWTGYTMVNNTIQSSKSGGPMAAAWAVLQFIGDEGYLELARRKLEAVRHVAEGIEAIPDLSLLTRPDMPLVAFSSETLDVFHLIDEMNGRGWYIQPALSYENSPKHVHLSISASNVAWVDRFLEDLRACVDIVKKTPPMAPAAVVGAGAEGVDLGDLGDEEVSALMEAAGISGGGLPSRMAGINDVLDGLPPEVRERLLTAYTNNAFVPDPEED